MLIGVQNYLSFQSMLFWCIVYHYFVARFNNIIIKKTIINELKLRYKNKQPSKANHINNILPDKILYINHKLMATNRKNFWLTKQSADEYKWKYVWFHSSGIYVRKFDGDSAIKIQTKRNRDKMSKLLRFCPFDIKFKIKLNRYKNILCTVIRMAKKLSYQKSLKVLQHNPKKMWKMIKEITGKVKSKDCK